MADDDNVSMHGSSPSSKGSSFEETKDNDNAAPTEADQDHTDRSRAVEEEIQFKDSPFQIPPLFNQPINKETLWDDDRLYLFWVSLRFPIPKDLVNPMVAVYNALKEFVIQLAKEDPHFVVFPHNLSKYKLLEDLPLPIKTLDDLPDNINNWLMYFPQAKPCISGGDTYTTLLIRLSIPFPKLVKSLSAWMKNKRFGLWKAYLQLEQPTLLGWLLFSMSTMDAELLKEAILDSIKNVPISLRWKTINIESQGSIPKNQQVKALPFMSMNWMSTWHNHFWQCCTPAKQAKDIFSLYTSGCALCRSSMPYSTPRVGQM